MTSPNDFCISPIAAGLPMAAGTALSTLMADQGKPVDPDHNYAEFSTIFELGDGSRRGAGFPSCSWHWSHLTEAQLRALRTIIPGASAQVYIRIPINDTTSGAALIWHTFTANAIWPSGERGKVPGYQVLDFELIFRTLVQVE